MSEAVIDVDVMTEDAEDVWQDASDQVLAMKDALPSIAAPDFSLAFDPFAMSRAFSDAVAGLSAYLDGGSTEFLTFEKNLLTAVIRYGESHRMTVEDIAKIRAEIDV